MISLLNLISGCIQLYIWVIVADVIVGWLITFGVLNPTARPVYTTLLVLRKLTEPTLGLVRRFLPSLGGLDFSPVVVIFGLVFIRSLLWEVAFNLNLIP